MITTILVDFARVVLLPIDPNIESMDELYKTISAEDFFTHFQLNFLLLAKLQELKEEGKNIVMYTNSNFFEDEAIKPNIEQTFSKIISARALGLSKSQPEDYTKLLTILKLQAENVVFIDDKEKNITAANTAGLAVIKHTENKLTISELSKI